MKRADLEHLIRAAGSISDSKRLAIVGSQAILGSFPEAPAELTVSQEADLFPLDAPARADLIDGSIGELSMFHETFGYYAHGVGPTTAVLAADWQKRAILIKNENTRGVAGLCLSPADLAISKLAAGRDKDLAFIAGMLRHGLITQTAIESLTSELQDQHKEIVRTRLRHVITRMADSSK